jgi:hypothetical protein
VIAGRIEFDWLDAVDVVVEAPDEPPRWLRLRADATSADTFFPAAGDAPLRVTTHWRGRAGEPSRSDVPRDIEGDTLIVDSPFADSIDVLVVPLPLAGVAALVVELRSDLGGVEQRKTVSWEAPAREPQRVGMRRLTVSPRTYAYRVQQVHDDGTLDDGPWTDTDATTLAIGPQGADGSVEVFVVQVVLLGGASGRGALAVELVFECADQRSTALIEGTHDNATLTLVATLGAPPPELIAREFLDTGAVRETRWPNPPPLVVLPPAAVVA